MFGMRSTTSGARTRGPVRARSGEPFSIRYAESFSTMAARYLATTRSVSPISRRRPCSSHRARSPMAFTSAMAWETNRIVTPRARSSCTLRMHRVLFHHGRQILSHHPVRFADLPKAALLQPQGAVADGLHIGDGVGNEQNRRCEGH